MTPAWADRLLPADAALLARCFPDGRADLGGSLLRALRLDRVGPACSLRLDLPGDGPESTQAHLGMLAVADVELAGGALPQRVDVEITDRPGHRVAVVVTGASLRLTLTCAEVLRFGRVSAHDTPPGAVDDGPHRFVGKLDQRLHRVVPGPEDENYHARF
ncbi:MULTISPECIES: hypothetical protein [Actinosynnema]|uniref:hypothetical protein n=1 Tax=Actinosynnema TaxID=40566 RepID=UPI0020A5B54D|nr:hypothetical protein [Actinosynnema pretiosum]MCP2099906.1 hypothetical protein [Actinosynnema pretiosum]